MCINDPCVTIQCPTGLDCTVGWDGAGGCDVPRVPQRDTVIAAGGGCATGGGRSDGLVALALLGLIGRRRRTARAARATSRR